MTPQARAAKRNDQRGQLTAREREIVGLLAEGMSGAEIAAKLFVSPETVRTHIRNAMGKLGASTRSQAVVLALQSDEIEERAGDERHAAPAGRSKETARRGVRSLTRSAELERALEGMLVSLCTLHDVDGGLVLLAEEDGFTLRLAAVAAANGSFTAEAPDSVALGEGPLGKVALDRRAALLPGLTSTGSGPGTALAAPILVEGHLLGVLGLVTRASRPTGRSELLVLQALVNRIGEILQGGEAVGRRLESTAERFGASWSAATQ